MNRLEQLLKMLEEEPDDTFISFAIGKEYESREDYSNALKYYNQIMESNPDYLGVYFHAGKIYEIIGKRDTAKIVYQSGITKAQSANDLHTLSELKTVLMNLELSDL